MNTTELQSKTIDFLRFPLAVGIVFAHNFVPAFDMTAVDYANFGVTDFAGVIRVLFSIIIPFLAVPVFYVFSGYLFFYKLEQFDTQTYKGKLKSRVKTLLIPYLFWNVIALLVMGWKIFVQDDSSFLEILNSLWAYNEIPGRHLISGEFMLTTPIDGPLWFVRDLMVVSVFSPLLYLLIKYTKWFSLIILFFFHYTNYWLYIPGFSILAFYFFGLGAYFSIHKLNIVEFCNKVKVPAWILFVPLLAICTYLNGNRMISFFLPFYGLAAIITLINITSYFINRGSWKLNSFLAKASFFLFAVHMIDFLKNTRKHVDNLLQPESVWTEMLAYVLVPVITIGICLLLYYLLKRIFPRFTSVITGNR